MYQSVSDGIAPLEQYDKRPNTIMAEVMTEIFPNKDSVACLRYNAEDFKSSYLRASMRAVGSDVVFICGLRNIDGHQIGRIQASYRDRTKAPDEGFVFDQLRALGNRIEVLKHEDAK
ncbi:hypothetical protein D3C71_1924940 [compost metagenome]